ncbi:MAG: SGNH/GDSL hydrolase family protein [Dehalococcoidia bacterium]
MRNALLALVALAALLAFACGDDADSNADGAGGVYLALGDSIAQGEGASASERTDYVALVEGALKQRYGVALTTVSLAVDGHTTQDLIDQQLQPAVDAIQAGDVRVVTVTIGGNDLYVLANEPACPADPQSPDCPFNDILAGAAQRLDTILRTLHEAGPATIAIELYPNLFSGTGNPFEGPATFAFGLLNDVIEQTAAQYDVLVADPRDDFEGRATELTAPNFHPNDDGYALIAAAFLRALGLQ